MTKLEVFRQAISELGEASAPELSNYIELKYGVTIPPAHVPLFQATLKGHADGGRRRPGRLDEQGPK